MDAIVQFISSIVKDAGAEIVLILIIVWLVYYIVFRTIPKKSYENNKQEINDLRTELGEVVAPTFDRMVEILEKQDEINRELSNRMNQQLEAKNNRPTALKDKESSQKLKVFLCHSKKDKSKVRKLYQRLTEDGFDAWMDENKLLPGHDWDLEIRKAVRDAGAVIVCLSKDSVLKTGYVQKEIRIALDVAEEQPEGTIYLIPVKLEACDVPTRLNRYQWVDLSQDENYKKLVSSLGLRAEQLILR